MTEEVTFAYRWRGSRLMASIPLHDVFSLFQISPDDPCQSAILLDLLRSAPAHDADFRQFKIDGWVKEIDLSHQINLCEVNFNYFFDLTDPNPLHPLLPDNQIARAIINRKLNSFRRNFIQYRPTLYSRHTHKNMSYSTRRRFERSTGIPLDGIPIFGQDDWIRHYHQTGEQLEGSVEMRQKWYPSGAKPRTYFAQGGTVYTYSRFLQDFFTLLVNAFPSTHHVTRLEPHRLQVPIDGSGHYLVYDLSSFTSNMQEQRGFCKMLSIFFQGVEVDVFDEYWGKLPADLGEMLEEYYDHCVEGPILNQERVPMDLRTVSGDYPHSRASMLGIYGNLMTCTVAHYLIVAPTCTDPDHENNTAGDDGLALYFVFTYFTLLMAISLVGVFAVDKTYKSHEAGAVCLKRPLQEKFDQLVSRDLHLKDNIVPPTLALCVTYLEGYDVDPRYTILYNSPGTTADAISIVGKDLLRFLFSAYSLNYNLSLIQEVFDGYVRLVQRITTHRPVIGGSVDRLHYVWPVSPDQYSFLTHDPYLLYAWYVVRPTQVFDKRSAVSFVGPLRFAGEVETCNSDPWLVLMEVLGYVEKVAVQEIMYGYDVVNHVYNLMRRPGLLDPVLYTYSVIKDIPPRMYI
jgi:hypothetical protein